MRGNFDVNGFVLQGNLDLNGFVVQITESVLLRINPGPPVLQLTDCISNGKTARVYTAVLEGQPVILKTVPWESEDLTRELTAYQRLGHLPCVPRLLGLYAPLGEDWVGFVLEDVGSPIGLMGFGDIADSTREAILNAVISIHHHGISHEDVAARNVLMKDGHVFIIDFGEAVDTSACRTAAPSCLR
ncbi:kinase-like domain-containing protein [Mycena metata]|uniref:Kinase-like domain-containing protein n=1 Tax=Mycena metata TaxID=1033252 RepID=A0AAD7J5W5_9AGAR|nr:kinase-like domain-containing protein [Mycena metata]